MLRLLRRRQRADGVQINTPDKHGVRTDFRGLDVQLLQLRGNQPVNFVSGRQHGIAFKKTGGRDPAQAGQQNKARQKQTDLPALPDNTLSLHSKR